MADQDKAVDEKSTNADLEKKADEILEKKEEVKETKQELKEAKEKLESDDIDQAEKSRLGRKVKRLEDVLTDMQNTLSMMARNMSSSSQAVKNEDDEPEYVSTPKDVERILEKRERKRLEDQRRYEVEYLKQIDKIADDDFHDDIMKVMMEHYNQRHSDNASFDAELNYEKASKMYFKQKVSKPRANLKGEKPGSNANVDVRSKSDESRGQEIKLDEHADALIKHYGMKGDDIKETLKGSFPAHLRGR